MRAIYLGLLIGVIPLRAQTNVVPAVLNAPTTTGGVAVSSAPAPPTPTNPALDLPLYQAAYNGDLAKVTALLAQGANINNRAGGNGYTSVMAAAGNKHWDVVKLLTAKGADLNLGSTTGMHALTYVLQQHQDQLALAMLNAGENPDLCDPRFFSPIVLVARNGNVELMKAFIAHHANVNLIAGEGPPIWHAIGYNHPEVVALLINAGARVDLPAHQSGTKVRYEDLCGSLVGYAVIHDDQETVDLLLAHGAAINAIGEDGETALTEAIIRAKCPMVTHLLEKGADPNLPNQDDQTPIMVACAYQYDPLILPTLLDHGARLEQTNSAGQTALIYAATQIQEDPIELLVDRGANVNAVDKSGETALGYAGDRGSTDIPDFLVAHGAQRTDLHIIARPAAIPPLSAAQAFALAASAMYTQYNGFNPHVLGGILGTISTDEQSRARDQLKDEWDADDAASFRRALNDLKGDGWGAIYRGKGAELAEMNDAGFAQLASASPILTGGEQLQGLRDSYLKWKDRSGIAWDRCRYINLVSRGYTAGYLGEAEAWADILPAARDLQRHFSSWQEMAANFLDGRLIWNKGHDERFEQCLKLLLEPYQANSVWNQLSWQTDLGP